MNSRNLVNIKHSAESSQANERKFFVKLNCLAKMANRLCAALKRPRNNAILQKVIVRPS